MHCAVVTVALAFVPQAHSITKELAANYRSDANRHSLKMFNRAVEALHLHHADLESTALLKPGHLAMSHHVNLKSIPTSTSSLLNPSSILRPRSLPHLRSVASRSPWAGHPPHFRRVTMRDRHVHVAATAFPEAEKPSNSTKAEVDLDAPMIDDGGLAAAFRKRVEQEGGAEMLNLKIAASDAQDAATAQARKAQRAVSEKVMNPADRAIAPAKSFLSDWWRKLDSNQKTIAKVIGGFLTINFVLQIVGGSMSSQPQISRPPPPTFEEYANKYAPNREQNYQIFNSGEGSFEDFKSKYQAPPTR